MFKINIVENHFCRIELWRENKPVPLTSNVVNSQDTFIMWPNTAGQIRGYEPMSKSVA